MHDIMQLLQHTKHIQGVCAMTIALEVENKKRFSSRIQIFFRWYPVRSILKKCSA